MTNRWLRRRSVLEVMIGVPLRRKPNAQPPRQHWWNKDPWS